MVNGTSFIEVEVTSCLSDKAFRIIYDNLLSFENIYSDDVVHTWSQSRVYTVVTHIGAACILPHIDTHADIVVSQTLVMQINFIRSVKTIIIHIIIH